MQNTKFRNFLNSLIKYIIPILSDSWSKRSLVLVSLLSGFYLTNSLISFFLDRAINTIFLAILLLFIMEVAIRASKINKFYNLSLIILIINNFRIGSTYALILEAFKLGS